MATAKKRVNLTIEDELYEKFEELQRLKDEPSMSSLILSLAKNALDLDEDLYFAKIANSRLKEKRYSHDEVWSKKK